MTQPVSQADTEEFLRLIGDVSETIVLVGGQAVGFWAARYQDRLPPLDGPLVSADVDFCSDRRAMRDCAARVNGNLVEATLDDATPNIGVLVWRHNLREIQVDFLGHPFGQDYADLLESSVPFRLHDSGASLRVMSPQRCFEARIRNLALEGYRTPHAIAQARASVVCCREFTRDVLHDNARGWRAASQIIERTFRFCRDNREARSAQRQYNLDPFDAVLHDDRQLPDAFVTRRYPVMQANIASRRT